MNSTAARFFRLAVGLSGLIVMGWVLTSQAAKPALEGLPTDWSHQHLIFSQPTTMEKVLQVTNDPRYWQQWARQNVPRVLSLDPAHGDRWPSADFASPASDKPRRHVDWAEDLGMNASPGAGNYPAKFSFRITTANCANKIPPDYVVFSTGLTGGVNQASIVAYDNLYSGCAVPVPRVYWAYNTGGQVLTSPAIDGDGRQVAFVQTNASFQGTLVVLKFAASGGSPSAPAAITTVTNASYYNCVAPCMTTVTLKNSVDDRTSSVFPDYTHDIIWVGGTSGWLHKITGVFHGTPTEVSTGGFPVQVNAGASALSSPVYDYASGQVFVADLGGFLYRVSSSGTVIASGRLDHGNVGIVAGPIVDSTNGKVYVFSSDDGSTACAGATAPCAGVYVFATNFGIGTTGLSEVRVGTASATPNPFYEGGFDSAYFSSGTGTGNLYVCGGTAQAPTIYRAPIAAGTFGAAVAVAQLTPNANHVVCSPVTDVPNPNTSVGAAENLFFGVVNNGRATACAAGGCSMSFVSMPWKATNSYKVGQEILVLRAGVLYINVVTTAGTSGAAQPAWSNLVGAVIGDSGVSWLNQGRTTVVPLVGWTANHLYGARTRIIDPNGNVEITVAGGTSGAGTPGWKTTAGANTTDGAVTWVNAGPWPDLALAATGGVSGTIMDNVVGAGTLTGASQIYYSTLGNQACTGGTGGCAVQAPQ